MADIMKSLEERVRSAVSAEPAYADTYLNLVLANWKEVHVAVRRTLTLMIVLVLAFLILATSKGTQITIGPFKLANTGPVVVLLPAVVSFLGCEYAILLRSSARYFNLYGHLMRLIHARFHDTDLYLLIGPPSLALWGGDPWLEVRKTPKGRTYRLLLVTSVPLGLLVAFALPTFLIYAYWRLFSQIDVSDLVVSLSAAFAALNVLRTILTILEWRNLA